jgi:hypothetical protein
MLMGSLGMLLCSISVFLAFAVIALAVMFRGGAVRLGRIFVMLGRLVMLVSGHFRLLN